MEQPNSPTLSSKRRRSTTSPNTSPKKRRTQAEKQNTGVLQHWCAECCSGFEHDYSWTRHWKNANHQRIQDKKPQEIPPKFLTRKEYLDAVAAKPGNERLITPPPRHELEAIENELVDLRHRISLMEQGLHLF